MSDVFSDIAQTVKATVDKAVDVSSTKPKNPKLKYRTKFLNPVTNEYESVESATPMTAEKMALVMQAAASKSEQERSHLAGATAGVGTNLVGAGRRLPQFTPNQKTTPAAVKGFNYSNKARDEADYQAKNNFGDPNSEGLEGIPLPPGNIIEANQAIRQKTSAHVAKAGDALETAVGAAVGLATGGTSLGAIAVSSSLNAAFKPGGGDAIIGVIPGLARVGKAFIGAVRAGDLAKTVKIIDQAGLAAKDAAELKAGLQKLAWRNETEETVMQKLGLGDARDPLTRPKFVPKEDETIPFNEGGVDLVAETKRQRDQRMATREAERTGKPKPVTEPMRTDGRAVGTNPPASPPKKGLGGAQDAEAVLTKHLETRDAPQVKNPKLDELPENANVTAARNASQNLSREKLGLDELPAAERKTFLESMTNATTSGEKNRTLSKAQALLQEKNPRAWNEEESAGAIIAQRELENEADELAKRIEADPNDIAAANRLNAVQAEYGTISDALNKVGTQAARTLSIRRLGLQPNYKPVVIKARIKALTGKEVDAKTSAYIDRLTKELRDAEENVVKLTNEANSAHAIDTVKTNSERAPRFSKEELDKELDDILKEFSESRKAAMGAAHDVVGATAGAVSDYSKLIGKVALNYTKRGINTLDEVVVKTIQYAKEKFGLELSEDDVIKGMNEASPKVTHKQMTDELVALKKNRINIKRDAKAYAANQQRIATLEQKIKYEFSNVPKTKRNPGKLIEDQRARITNLKKELETTIEARRPKGTLEKLGNIAGAPRSLASSVDISAPGRQGWLLALAHPQHAIKAFKHQIGALLSEEYTAKVANSIKARANYADYERDGLYLSELSAAPNKAEEAFKSRLFAPWTKYNPIRASERAYTTYLNVARAEAYDTMRSALPDITEGERKAIANWVNVASGRGGINANSAVGKAMEGAAGVLFSPRYQISRIQFLAGQPLYSGSARTRALVAGEYGKVLGAVSQMLIVAKAAGAEVSMDPNSSDFLKIKIGDTRVDLAAGLQQYLVLGSRVLTQQKTTADGDTKNAGPGLGERFARSKANPTAGFVYDLTLGGRKNYLGEDLSWKEALNMLPMSPKEMVEGLVEDGWGREDAIGLLNFFGIGIQTYKAKPKKDRPN